ncbi:hypothetical protein [Streptomyces sp. NPDC087300]|uniref:hypothetical protein n=1 Tax=Streptomyces sp. NPDC087300 TaxID=3365780 RepID=UPI003817A96F
MAPGPPSQCSTRCHGEEQHRNRGQAVPVSRSRPLRAAVRDQPVRGSVEVRGRLAGAAGLIMQLRCKDWVRTSFHLERGGQVLQLR